MCAVEETQLAAAKWTILRYTNGMSSDQLADAALAAYDGKVPEGPTR